LVGPFGRAIELSQGLHLHRAAQRKRRRAYTNGSNEIRNRDPVGSLDRAITQIGNS